MTGASAPIDVLHVDDDPDLSSLIATFLERKDERIDVRTALDAEDALAQLAAHEVDCVVSDFDMPGADGIELLEAIREDHPDLPFVLYTGKGSEEVASDAISAGVSDYMQKESGTDQYAVLANRVVNLVEQHRTEREAERSRRRLRELSESTDDCLWMFDSDWSELVFVSGYEEVWGRPESAIREDPGDFLDAVHPDDREFVRAAMASLSQGEPRDIEYRIRRGDGELRWVWVKGEPVYDEDGTVVRVVGFTRDVTEHKTQQRRLETLIGNLPGIAYRCRTDPDWSMELVRGECEALTGYPSEAIESGEVDWGTDVLHPDDREGVWTTVQDALDEDRSYEVTYRIRAQDGETRWMRERGQRVSLPDGDEASVEGFITDVTARRARERELERYEAYLEESSDVITVLGASGTIQYQSPAVERILGYEAGALLGRDGFDFIHPEDVDAVRERFLELVGDPGATVTVECRFRTAADDWRWLEVRGTNKLDHESIEGVVTNSRDITERRRRERQLEQFASLVSHDLRNPLSVAEGSLQLAREEHDDERLERAADALSRMDDLIEDVLAVARSGSAALEAEPVALADVVEQCWRTVETADATLAVDADPTVRADRGQLRQLVENLVGNAVTHAGPDVTVTVGTLDDGFYVEDDGPGIAEDRREAVFETGVSSASEGTGFGLTIVEQVASAHGWDVRLTSGEAGGARFEFRGVECAE